MQWPEGALWSGPLSPAATIPFSLCSIHWPPRCSHLPTLLNAFAFILPSPWNTLSQDSCLAHFPYILYECHFHRQGFPELYKIAFPPAPTLSVPLALPMALTLSFSPCCHWMTSFAFACLLSVSAVKWEGSHASWERDLICFALLYSQPGAWC